MRARMVTFVVAAGLALSGWAGATALWHVSAVKTTKTYKLTLDVGPTEPMYTQAQVEAQHPKTGEVMIGSGSSMGTGGHAAGMESSANAHLEVHVRLRATGEVLGSVAPAIALKDVTAKGMSMPVDAMAMEGIGEGLADLHYGNNLSLQPGHTYVVTVAVKGQRATFTFRAA